MPTPVHTPRVNNNDDTVRLTRVLVTPGAAVHAGDIVAEVETDKANFTVETENDGFVLAVAHEVNQVIPVGSVLLWLGATPDETPPVNGTSVAPLTRTPKGEPTIKAAQLLAQHKLRAEDVPASGDRLTAADVENFIRARATSESAAPPEAARDALASGTRRALSPAERGMLHTVVWQRDEAVPGYVELQYDTAAWERAAAEYQQREKLLLSPLLALMAYRLARIAASEPRVNATLAGDEYYSYSDVNLGFTVQSDTTLYLVVVPGAGSLTCREFIDRLGALQRAALGHRLAGADVTRATVSFSSMARWQVTRHVPVLPPHTALIVAHAAPAGQIGTLGATYDHRILTGFDAVSVLRAMTRPEGLE